MDGPASSIRAEDGAKTDGVATAISSTKNNGIERVHPHGSLPDIKVLECDSQVLHEPPSILLHRLLLPLAIELLSAGADGLWIKTPNYKQGK